MEYFAGLDVATEETAICVIDGAGSIVLEATVATDPETIWRALREHLPRLRRVGHEAGSLSPWLQAELTKLGLPAVPRSFQTSRRARKSAWRVRARFRKRRPLGSRMIK